MREVKVDLVIDRSQLVGIFKSLLEGLDFSLFFF